MDPQAQAEAPDPDLGKPDYVVLPRATAEQIRGALHRITRAPGSPVNTALVAALNEALVTPRPTAMIEVLTRQFAFSHHTFGPGTRTLGVLQHLRKELAEVEKNPFDLVEWIDVALLALDGAWRHATYEDQFPGDDSPEPCLYSEDFAAVCDHRAAAALVVETFLAKLEKNMKRSWPDWRDAPTDAAIEHDRSGE